MERFSPIYFPVSSKSLKSYHTAAAWHLLNYGNFNAIKQSSVACRKSRVSFGGSQIPQVYLSFPPTYTPNSPFKTPASVGLLKSPVSTVQLWLTHFLPQPAGARTVMFHLLCKKLNVTLWCLLALKFPGHGMRGNFSVSIRLLLTPFCVRTGPSCDCAFLPLQSFGGGASH